MHTPCTSPANLPCKGKVAAPAPLAHATSLTPSSRTARRPHSHVHDEHGKAAALVPPQAFYCVRNATHMYMKLPVRPDRFCGVRADLSPCTSRALTDMVHASSTDRLRPFMHRDEGAGPWRSA